MMNRKRYLKTLFSILSLVFLMMALVSCGTDEVSQSIMDDIDSIGEVTLDDSELIERTLSRYETLTDKQKNQVKNYSTLLAAEDELKALQSESESQMKEYFNTAVTDIYSCAIETETIIGDLRKIWEDDIDYVEGVFYNDAQWEATLGIWSIGDYAPLNLMTTTRENVAKLKESNQVVVKDNEVLTNWPENMSEEKTLYDEYYNYYLNLYDSATSPSGSYITYCQNTNDYLDGFNATYKKLEPYLSK